MKRKGETYKQVKARLKIWLLRNFTITHNQAQRMWSTNRIAIYIHQLRKEGMKIDTKMVYNGRDQYAVYQIHSNKRV